MDVEVRKSEIEGAGRGLFAKKDFSAGDIVLSLDRPFVAELDIDRLQDSCAWCFRRGANAADGEDNRMFDLFTADVETKACTGCKRVRYCSKSCQTKAWKREHKYECKVIAPESRPDLPHGVRATIKLLGRLKNDPEGKDDRLLDILQFQPCGYDGGSALEDIKKESPQRFEDYSMLAYGAWKYSGEPVLGGMDSQMIAKAFFFNVMSNTVQLSNPLEDISLGIGFDPIICSANHSCDPQVECLFNQPSMLLRALRPIRKGEEIFMKYVDITNPQSVRQSELKKTYSFTCRCSKCSKGAIFPQDQFLKLPEQLIPEVARVADGLINRHAKQLASFHVSSKDELAGLRMAAIQADAFSVSGLTFDFNKGNDAASEDEILDAFRLCRNSGMWSLTRQPVPHLLRQLFALYMVRGRVYQAWRLGILRHFFVNPILNPSEYEGQRAVDAWALSFLTNRLCNPNPPESKDVFDECMKVGLDLRFVYLGLLIQSRELVGKSYGKDAPFGKAVENIYQQVLNNTDMPLPMIEEKVRETWPKLEAVAKSVDVLRL